MPRWVQRRLGFILIVFCAAIIINFIILRLMPGDITDIYMSKSWDVQTTAGLKERFGLDKPLITQFWLYLKNTFTGNFGISLAQYPRNVSSLIADALPRSLALLIPALMTNVLIGYFLGVKAGWRAGSKSDSAITGISLYIWAAPMFWVAMIILYIFAFLLGWFPLSGYYTIGASYANIFEKIGDYIYHAFLPFITLVICRFGASVLVMRNTLTITLKEAYITSAHAKGLSEGRVKHRHAARNALLPLVTSTALGVAVAASGSVFIETIFSYPGIGRLLFNSVVNRDYTVLQGCFLIFTIMIILMVTLLDFIYTRLDPRVRY